MSEFQGVFGTIVNLKDQVEKAVIDLKEARIILNKERKEVEIQKQEIALELKNIVIQRKEVEEIYNKSEKNLKKIQDDNIKLEKKYENITKIQDENIKIKNEYDNLKIAYLHIIQKFQTNGNSKINNFDDPYLGFVLEEKVKEEFVKVFVKGEMIEIIDLLLKFIYNSPIYLENQSLDMELFAKKIFKIYQNKEWIIITEEEFIKKITIVVEKICKIFNSQIKE